MKGISNVYIDKFLKKLEIEHFKGVFSCDTIPVELANESNFSIVCNLSKFGSHGSHFVTLIYNKPLLKYLDPLALNATIHGDIQTFISSMPHCKSISVLQKPIQAATSHFCGFYCIYFILYHGKKQSGRRLFGKIKPFSPNLKMNDDVCIDNIITLTKQ